MSEFDDLMKQKAVALKYNPDKNGAPVIVASGMGYLAERITETAMAAGVPVYEDDSLATLLTQLQLGAEIPMDFLGYIPEKEQELPEEEDSEEGDLGNEEEIPD